MIFLTLNIFGSEENLGFLIAAAIIYFVCFWFHKTVFNSPNVTFRILAFSTIVYIYRAK